MTKREKRIARLKQVKGDVSFRLVGQVLQDCGYKFVSTRGSHFKFSKPGTKFVIIPVHNKKVKYCHVKSVIHDLRL
jgi:predicted RNA binding protein YcfA (HicA-like mRNA interferase family)